MEKSNPLYKNQGIHVIANIFTIENGIVKVLLIKRNNEPFKNMWGLVGGALYNNETLNDGMLRELKEKTGIESIKLDPFDIFSDVDRSPIMRMIAVSYIGVIDSYKVNVLKETMKTNDSDWVSIDSVGKLAYDHNKILNSAKEKLKELICNSNILSSLYPEGFTIPEIQMAYESILEKKFDRRNFRKKLVNSGLIIDTGNSKKVYGNKPAKLYKFKDKIVNKRLLLSHLE